DYAVWQGSLTGTSYLANTLTPGHDFRAWLRAVDANGSGPWSAANFSVFPPLSAPAITAPAFNATAANPPTIAWVAVPGAATYHLRLDDSITATDYVVWQGALTGTTYVSGPLTTGHIYRLWVRALDAGGNAGPWSATLFNVAPGLAA